MCSWTGIFPAAPLLKPVLASFPLVIAATEPPESPTCRIFTCSGGDFSWQPPYSSHDADFIVRKRLRISCCLLIGFWLWKQNQQWWILSLNVCLSNCGGKYRLRAIRRDFLRETHPSTASLSLRRTLNSCWFVGADIYIYYQEGSTGDMTLGHPTRMQSRSIQM